MALYDRLLTFGTNMDPTNMTANTSKYLGDSIDTTSGTYYKSGISTHTLNQVGSLGDGTPVYWNVIVNTSFDTGTNRLIRFFLASSSSVSTAGNLTGTPLRFVESHQFTVTSTTNELEKGFAFSIALPTYEHDRYIQFGLVSSTSDSDESGRVSSYLSLIPATTGKMYSEGQVW